MTHAIPAIMYHSIGPVLADWAWRDLTTPDTVFEDHLRWLRRAGYRTCTLAELDAHMRGDAVLPARTVALTFDDGYLDNWTHAAPLLEKYGYSGTIVVTPEFVDPRESVRPTLRELWSGSVAEGDLETRGFMSWEELRRASQAGWLDVQCHAMTHTWYPHDDEVVDFHHPGDHVYWLDWNAHPEDKPFYLSHPGASRVPYGTPVYAHAKSLEVVRFFPDPREAEHLCAIVADTGAAFFEQAGWRERLGEHLGQWRREHARDTRSETDAERRERIYVELLDSKRVIEEHVGRPVDYLIWPGGGYDEASMTVAREVYRAVTISSSDRWRYANRPGENPGRIVRRGAPELKLGAVTTYAGGRYFVEFLREFQGSRLARRKRQMMKLAMIARARLGGKAG